METQGIKVGMQGNCVGMRGIKVGMGWECGESGSNARN